MKATSTRRKLAFLIIGISVLSLSFTSCTKDNVTKPGNAGSGVHNVHPQLAGKWMWTQGSSDAYYDDNGTYNGASYGYATQYNIGADGYGTCFNHVFSTLGGGTGFEVNIFYNGFYESDDQGHLGFFPTSGTYKTSNGTNRALNADELWNVNARSGRSLLSQKLVITTQGGRPCFQVTASDGTVDTFFKVQ